MRALLGCCAAWALSGGVHAADWPANTTVVVGSTSPDGRYGILISDQGHPGDETVEVTTHLADLKSHRILGRIDASYSAGMTMSVVWVTDSSWAVATYGVRDGFRSIELLQPSAAAMKETSLGTRILKDTGRFTSRTLRSFVREGAGGRIEIRATGTSDPRGRNPKAVFAYFRGCYDPASSVWSEVKIRACSEEEWEDLSAAFERSALVEGETPEEKAGRLDKQLNRIYTALHRLMPPQQFAVLRKEQREWLAGAGKTGDLARANQHTEARVVVLEKLLWSL